jgi:histidine triad (HIT) family protein
VVNSGIEGGQEVDHLHFHILGGARPWNKRAAPAASEISWEVSAFGTG